MSHSCKNQTRIIRLHAYRTYRAYIVPLFQREDLLLDLLLQLFLLTEFNNPSTKFSTENLCNSCTSQIIMDLKPKKLIIKTLENNEEKFCNAPIPRVRRRYCDVYTQVENTLMYIR